MLLEQITSRNREMIYQDLSGSLNDIERIQMLANEETGVGTGTQLKVERRADKPDTETFLYPDRRCLSSSNIAEGNGLLVMTEKSY